MENGGSELFATPLPHVNVEMENQSRLDDLNIALGAEGKAEPPFSTGVNVGAKL